MAIELQTERLRLRPWREADLEPLIELFTEPKVWWYPLRRGFTAAETNRFLQRRFDEWATRGWGLWRWRSTAC
jgi:RimJ/RimL family protein N-acetyltransferase